MTFGEFLCKVGLHKWIIDTNRQWHIWTICGCKDVICVRCKKEKCTIYFDKEGYVKPTK